MFKTNVLGKADRNRGRFRGLLLSITCRVISNHLRHGRAKKRGANQIFALEDFDAAKPENRSDFDNEWVAYIISLAMKRVSTRHPNYHAALRAVVFDGMTPREFAEKIGAPVSSVRNHLLRGRKKLIEYIRGEVRNYARTHEEWIEELNAFKQFMVD